MTQAATRAHEVRQRVQHNNWNALRYFNFYRIVIAGVFTILSLSGKLPPNLSDVDTRLFVGSALGYLVFAIGAMFLVEQRGLTYRLQVYGGVLADVGATSLLMHAAGGVTSGIGILLVMSVAGACLLASGRAAVFFAALASMALLGETFLGTLYDGYSAANYTQAGLLGAACFGTAVLASALAERARRGEALAAARALDIEHLSRLNEHIVRRMRAGIMVLDSNGAVVLANDAAAEILGHESHQLRGALADISASLHDSFRGWLGSGENPAATIGGHGSINALVSFTELGTGEPEQHGTLVFLEDAAETRQRAQQLKLASLGRLTASIAHEIRNPLGAISHAAQLLSESPDLTSQDRRLTDIVLQHAQRVNAIIENVMTIGRRHDVVSESFALRPWLEQFRAELAERFELDDGELALTWLHEPIVVKIDKSQLQQVLWNLSENGLRYAAGTPLLRFEAGIIESNGRPFLDVVDSGPGLSEAISDRLFEPFATTESSGTGLGLYIARELCESNQASLQLIERQRGCRFRIVFAHPGRQQRIGEV
ncbi:MAG: PAS domain-containing protein [Proteobacteria bacterium]|nr:PAS domain-containing protein [Pseudomonadota bacterium]